MGDTGGWLQPYSICTSRSMKLWIPTLFHVLVLKYTIIVVIIIISAVTGQ